jgi:hypothetical protein
MKRRGRTASGRQGVAASRKYRKEEHQQAGF